MHNAYGKFSGEESVVEQEEALLRAHGHTVRRFSRSSAELEGKILGPVKGFFSGIHNPFSRRAFARFLAEQEPDVVHAHNVFPLISPSVLPECGRQGIPAVMTLHNYRLICPNALLARNGNVCRECLGGREWRCVFHNCEHNVFKSLGYALRTAIARKRRFFLDSVNLFICLTDFQRQIFIHAGFPPDRCIVIPNFISIAGVNRRPHAANSLAPSANDERRTTNDASFVLYLGRVSLEKDVPTLIESARKLPNIPFKVAGSYWRMPDLPQQAPSNVEFVGEVSKETTEALYAGARLVVFATRCYEGFPSVLLEAMAHGRPVICARIGGLPEIIEDQVEGLFYDPGRADDLAERIGILWANEEKCRSMGQAGRRKVVRDYGPDLHYDRLMAAYAKAREEGRTR